MVNAPPVQLKRETGLMCDGRCSGIALAIGGYMITKHAPKPPKPEVVAKGPES